VATVPKADRRFIGRRQELAALDEALDKPDLADDRAMLEQVRAARQQAEDGKK